MGKLFSLFFSPRLLIFWFCFKGKKIHTFQFCNFLFHSSCLFNLDTLEWRSNLHGFSLHTSGVLSSCVGLLHNVFVSLFHSFLYSKVSNVRLLFPHLRYSSFNYPGEDEPNMWIEFPLVIVEVFSEFFISSVRLNFI